MFLPSKGLHNMLLLILHVPHTQKKKKEGKKKKPNSSIKCSIRGLNVFSYMVYIFITRPLREACAVIIPTIHKADKGIVPHNC